ncbi:MAG: hypothetical protein HZC28_20195 [Spirochaetes bacterium]|nr:hypothetical protein [Spirochaetota bacterium]
MLRIIALILAVVLCLTGCMSSPFGPLTGMLPVQAYNDSVPQAEMTVVSNYAWISNYSGIFSTTAFLQPKTASDGTNFWIVGGYGNDSNGMFTSTLCLKLIDGSTNSIISNSHYYGVITNNSGSNLCDVQALAWNNGALAMAMVDYYKDIYLLNPATGLMQSRQKKPECALRFLVPDGSGYFCGYYSGLRDDPLRQSVSENYGIARSDAGGKLLMYYNAGNSQIFGTALRNERLYIAQVTPVPVAGGSWSMSDIITVKIFVLDLRSGAYVKAFTVQGIDSTGPGDKMLCNFYGIPNGNFLFVWKKLQTADPIVLLEIKE